MFGFYAIYRGVRRGFYTSAAAASAARAVLVRQYGYDGATARRQQIEFSRRAVAPEGEETGD